MSPLGKYAQIVAAIAAIGIIAAYAGALLISNQQAGNALHDFALIAIGAIFGSSAGSAVTLNGTNTELSAIHSRLDSAGIASASAATAINTAKEKK
jgi:hypothetical protein